LAELAPVSTAPPSQSVTTPSELDPAVANAIAYFRSKRSGLTEAEIEHVALVTVREARRQDLDPKLVMAVIHIESRGNAFARSPVGALGLMQVMPATGEELAANLELPWSGPHALFDPILNVRLGTAYLKQLERRFGSTKTALAAYNAGPGRIDRRLRRGAAPPAGYSDSVLAAYATQRALHGPQIVPVSYRH
jgi:soluble lytic murein transglycosylase